MLKGEEVGLEESGDKRMRGEWRCLQIQGDRLVSEVGWQDSNY